MREKLSNLVHAFIALTESHINSAKRSLVAQLKYKSSLYKKKVSYADTNVSRLHFQEGEQMIKDFLNGLKENSKDLQDVTLVQHFKAELEKLKTQGNSYVNEIISRHES